MSGTNESRNDSHELYSTLRAEFCLASDGSIRDRSRRGWMIWNISHFQLWWNALETTANVPLGRKLMNCSADQEEHMVSENSLFDVGWFMKKKRQRDIVDRRWKMLGWGKFDIAKSRISSHLMAPLCSGFALVAKEQVLSNRQRIQWQQLSNTHIELDFEPSPNTIDKSPPEPSFFWNTQELSSSDVGELELDLEILKLGWSHAGERCFLIPSGLFARLFDVLSFQGILPKPSWSEEWSFPEEISSSHSVSFVLICLSIHQMVSQTEVPVYIQDIDSWQRLSEAYLEPFGFGRPNSFTSVDEQGGVEFEISPSPHFPFLVGFLLAFWQRGYGKKAKVSLHKEGDFWRVRMTSFLSYA
ncbi:MAG: hypothetical protein CMA09_01375 [Euryarchaeota archaeon]|nr:hypothetical protein [Euryarchaeota archaeon]